jgi:hypothetical protein
MASLFPGFLSLENNRLTGLIPSELGLMVGLLNMTLSSNELLGPIPTELGTMISLGKSIHKIPVGMHQSVTR